MGCRSAAGLSKASLAGLAPEDSAWSPETSPLLRTEEAEDRGGQMSAGVRRWRETGRAC